MTPNSLPASLADLLPRLQSFERLSLDAGDIVIHAPGFEDRTMAVANAVLPSPGASAILLDYLPFNPRNRLSDVRQALFAKGIEIVDDDVLKYNRFEPDDFETRLRMRLVARGLGR